MKRACLITAGLALIGAIALGLYFWLKPHWPEFPATTNNQPQVIMEVERDYAHHIGDLITVDMFVLQHPGTVVDPLTLKVDGDFELAGGKPEIKEKKLDDGSLIYRFRLKVQFFKAKPEQVLKTAIGWKDGNDRKELAIPDKKLYWSNTWDTVRKDLMEGDDPRVPAWYYISRHAVPLALSSALFLVLLTVALVRFIRANRKTVTVDLAKKRVAELLDKVVSGTCSKAEHLELDGLMRERFSVGPIPTSQLDGRMLNVKLVAFLRANEPAIYAEDTLDDEKAGLLAGLGNAVLKVW